MTTYKAGYNGQSIEVHAMPTITPETIATKVRQYEQSLAHIRWLAIDLTDALEVEAALALCLRSANLKPRFMDHTHIRLIKFTGESSVVYDFEAVLAICDLRKAQRDHVADALRQRRVNRVDPVKRGEHGEQANISSKALDELDEDDAKVLLRKYRELFGDLTLSPSGTIELAELDSRASLNPNDYVSLDDAALDRLAADAFELFDVGARIIQCWGVLAPLFDRFDIAASHRRYCKQYVVNKLRALRNRKVDADAIDDVTRDILATLSDGLRDRDRDREASAQASLDPNEADAELDRLADFARDACWEILATLFDQFNTTAGQRRQYKQYVVNKFRMLRDQRVDANDAKS